MWKKEEQKKPHDIQYKNKTFARHDSRNICFFFSAKAFIP